MCKRFAQIVPLEVIEREQSFYNELLALAKKKMSAREVVLALTIALGKRTDKVGKSQRTHRRNGGRKRHRSRGGRQRNIRESSSSYGTFHQRCSIILLYLSKTSLRRGFFLSTPRSNIIHPEEQDVVFVIVLGMKKIIHRERERGGANIGWLQSRFSFSFSNWHEPSRMGFGRLRVINDDVIAPLGKFGMHSHHDFEIITIPLVGTVTHEDSLGNIGEVHAGEAQAMSAGTGVVHSEYNASKTEPLSLFQIWIEPNVQGAKPRYTQARFDSVGRKNSWQILVSGDGIP